MIRHSATIVELLQDHVFSQESPFQVPLTGTVTVYPRQRAESLCEQTFCGTRGHLKVTRQQWYLVLVCRDGQRRSFGQGTRMSHEYSLPASPATV